MEGRDQFLCHLLWVDVVVELTVEFRQWELIEMGERQRERSG